MRRVCSDTLLTRKIGFLGTQADLGVLGSAGQQLHGLNDNEAADNSVRGGDGVNDIACHAL